MSDHVINNIYPPRAVQDATNSIQLLYPTLTWRTCPFLYRLGG